MDDDIQISGLSFRRPYGKRRLSAGRFFYYLHFGCYKTTVEEYQKNPEKFVRSFTVTINGKRRKIVTYQANADGRHLRDIHRMMYYVIRYYYKPSPCSFAYQDKLNTVSLLQKHLDSDVFLKTDIHSFFESIDFVQLKQSLFKKCPSMSSRPSYWSRVLSTCFYDNHLPIGFVSSPLLSDIYLNDLDNLFSVYENVVYTRYADDFVISSSGENADELLKNLRNDLEKQLASLSLQLNKKKTYIRELKQTGDAIHLLGLNVVKTTTPPNRITVSDRYIREVSKDLCRLMHEKNNLKSWEARKRFCEVVGRISYINHASLDSSQKLKKLIRIKAGVDIELAYNTLAPLCLTNVTDPHKYEEIKQDESLMKNKPVCILPANGRVWEKVQIQNSEKSYDSGTLRYYLFSLCRVLEQDDAQIQINRLSLSIGNETRELREKEDIPLFRDHIRKIKHAHHDITYSADYHYHNNPDRAYYKCGQVYLSAGGYRPLIGYYGACGDNVLYSEEENSWLFTSDTSAAELHYQNRKVLKPCSCDFILSKSSWRGSLSIDWQLPFHASTEEKSQTLDLEKTIVNSLFTEEYKKDLSEQHQQIEFSGQLDSKNLRHILDTLGELVTLVRQADGEVNVNCWFIPSGFLESKEETTFEFFTVYNDENGKLHHCSFTGLYL